MAAWIFIKFDTDLSHKISKYIKYLQHIFPISHKVIGNVNGKYDENQLGIGIIPFQDKFGQIKFLSFRVTSL
jgi:hypothetical protein